jgi:cobalt/nickel transport system permease protein
MKIDFLKPKLLLFLYFAIIITISAQIRYEPLMIFLVVLLLIGYKESLIFFKKALLLVAVFSLSISVSYCAILFWQNRPFLDYFLTVNLRAIDITMLSLIFVSRVNIFESFAFSKELSFLLVMSVSKIVTLKRVFVEYNFALKSRTIKKPTSSEIYGYLGSSIAGFLDKSIEQSKENYLAMKSRGFNV